MTDPDNASKHNSLPFEKVIISKGDIELLECQQCFALVRETGATGHVDWHFEAAKKVDRASSPFGAMSFLTNKGVPL